MGKRFRFAVLRARHDNTVTYTSDQACREMLIDNLNNSAILQYSIFNTGSYLELSADLLPWVDISLTWAIVNNRAAHAQAVYDATVTPKTVLRAMTASSSSNCLAAR